MDALASLKSDLVAALRAGDRARVLDLSQRLATAEPSSDNLLNVALALRDGKRPAEARDWVLEHRILIDPIEATALLSALAADLGDETEAIRWGNESLRLRDADAPPGPVLQPVTRRFDPTSPDRNVIAFSLWGASPRYVRGALINAEAIRFIYPGWTARFYVDESVPTEAVQALRAAGAQLLTVSNSPPETYGMFWRLLVEDDPDVDFYLIRDADAVVNAKERWAVDDWLKTGTAFHVMRDFPAHCELILGGMWGAQRGNIGGMRDRVIAFVRNYGNRRKRAYDQEFLRREIWPIVRQSMTQHDRCFDLREPRRYDPSVELPPNRHIGQNLFGG